MALQRGLSLIELMVAITIATVLVFGLSTLFVTNSRNFAENERSSRQIENGRYATKLLSEDLRHAGFYGEVANVTSLPALPSGVQPFPPPTALPDPCLTTVGALKSAMPLPIQGVDAPDATPSCLPDYMAGTDVLVIRRADTDPIAAALAVANEYYTQTSFCSTTTTFFDLSTNATGFPLQDKGCANPAQLRKYHVSIYFISPCSLGTAAGGACAAGDPQLPTLKRMELGPTGFTVTPLVEGIENMQLEYGLDTPPGDGAPNAYTAKPTGGTGPAIVAAWASVVSVRIHVLARNVDATAGFTDTKTYQLGNKADGTPNNVTPGGSYKRHEYTAVVRLTDLSQRKETPL